MQEKDVMAGCVWNEGGYTVRNWDEISTLG